MAPAVSDSPAGLLSWILEKHRSWSDCGGDVSSRFSDARVEVPTAVTLFPHDLASPPRSWIERTYNLVRYTRMPRGGHFAPHEEPALLADDIAAFAGALPHASPG